MTVIFKMTVTSDLHLLPSWHPDILDLCSLMQELVAFALLVGYPDVYETPSCKISTTALISFLMVTFFNVPTVSDIRLSFAVNNFPGLA